MGERPACRLLPTSVADGAWQMAPDEVMLESAAGGVASLRFYRWSEPTLSLGYFQTESVRRSKPRLHGLAYVRRATGGGALVHHHELTYALALPGGAPWQRRGESWIARMHRVIGNALRSFGADVELIAPNAARKLGDTLCFLDQTPCDVVARGQKVVGSAQRKRMSALLQHGGILLGRSEYTPELAGLQELVGLTTKQLSQLQLAVVSCLEKN